MPCVSQYSVLPEHGTQAVLFPAPALVVVAHPEGQSRHSEASIPVMNLPLGQVVHCVFRVGTHTSAGAWYEPGLHRVHAMQLLFLYSVW